MMRFLLVFGAVVSWESIALASPDITPRARVLTSFAHIADESDTTSRFDLDSLEVGLRVAWGQTFFIDTQLDAVRSASPDSLFGIDGNSILLIARRALVDLRLPLGPGHLRMSLGLLPDPVVTAIETADLRILDDALADVGLFLPRSDLGASLRYELAWASLTLAVTHGEGARDVERDDRKDAIAMLEVTPVRLEFLGDEAELRLMVSGRTGSRGVGSVAHDHLGAWVALIHPRVNIGLEGHLAWGYDGRPVDALGVSGTGAFGVLDGLFLTARYDWLDLDQATEQTSLRTLDLGLMMSLGRLFGPVSPELEALSDHVRLRLAWRHTTADALAAPTPGVPSTGTADLVVLSLEGRSW